MNIEKALNDKRCYTVKEVQDMLEISRPSVYELLKRNEFRWIKIGIAYRISKKALMTGLTRCSRHKVD